MTAPPELVFELAGNWTSGRILVRLLMVVECPWQPLRAGFIHKDTGERAQLAMAPPQPALTEALAAGVDPVLPSIDDELLGRIAHHKSVVLVTAPGGPDPLKAALTAARAANAIVDGGALALRCRTGGLAHGADPFQWLVAQAEQAAEGTGELDLAAALFPIYIRRDLGGPQPQTLGMAALGAPDVVLPHPEPPARAAARLEHHALALLRGAEIAAEPDERGLPEGLHNPLGVFSPPPRSAPR